MILTTLSRNYFPALLDGIIDQMKTWKSAAHFNPCHVFWENIANLVSHSSLNWSPRCDLVLEILMKDGLKESGVVNVYIFQTLYTSRLK